MKIDLDQIIQQISAEPVEITIGGRAHRTRRLSVADAERLARCGEVRVQATDAKPAEFVFSDAQNAEFLASLFDGGHPECLDVMRDPGSRPPDAIYLNRELVLLVMQALAASYWRAFDELKKSRPSLDAIRAQIGLDPIGAVASAAGDGSSSS